MLSTVLQYGCMFSVGVFVGEYVLTMVDSQYCSRIYHALSWIHYRVVWLL